MNCQRAHIPHKFQVRPKTSHKTSTRDSRSHLLLRLEGLPWWLRQKESTCNAGDPSLIPGSGEGISYPLQYSWASVAAQMVKNPSAVWETWVRSLGWEDPLQKGMVTHSSILAWRIPWTEEPGRLQARGVCWGRGVGCN